MTKNQIKRKEIKPKLKLKQPVKTKKNKKIFVKKESNVDKQELASHVSKLTSKESQIDWIVCRI